MKIRLALHSNIFVQKFREIDELLRLFTSVFRYRHEIVIYKNRIYVFGGGTATECDKFQFIYAFNLLNKSWERIKTTGPFPEERKCHSCVKDDRCRNNLFYKFGILQINLFKSYCCQFGKLF